MTFRLQLGVPCSPNSGSWEERKDDHDWSSGLELEVFKHMISPNPDASRIQLPEMNEQSIGLIILVYVSTQRSPTNSTGLCIIYANQVWITEWAYVQDPQLAFGKGLTKLW